MNNLALQRRSIPWRMRRAGIALAGAAVSLVTAPAQAQPAPLVYDTLNFGTTGTFLTGIRGDNIVGNYVIAGTSNTGGLLYTLSSGIFQPFRYATPNGANYPGAISSSPYGPSFGSLSGILRVVGSYQTPASAPYDLGYLYDGAAVPGTNLTTLAYPSVPGVPTLFTIAHSTFGDQVVGNYDTQLATGNAFLYTISTGTYATNNFPGAISTTAYGVWGDKIAGGYEVPGGVGLGRGYIYDKSTATWTSYNHPGAIETHFEGITGAGRANEYNLVVDWVDVSLAPHASVLHIAADNTLTWIELNVPGGSVTSANSIYANQAIGVYVANGVSNGYVVSIPGIYNPISNATTLSTNTPNVPALSGGTGHDVINSGSIHTAGANSSGIRSDTYGVVTNSGVITVTGAGSAGVELSGNYGTLLNGGTIAAAAGADAIRTDVGATGTAIVNLGVIDGRVMFRAGPQGRFENSGELGISTSGAGTTHVIDGTFAQTSAGVLSLRAGATSNDAVQIAGAARLAGELVSVFQPGGLQNAYTLLSATGGRTGTFDTFTPVGLQSFVTAALGYAPDDVTLSLTSGMAEVAGLSSNESAVGGALDAAFNTEGSLPGGLGLLFDLTPAALRGALDSLSGEIHASTQSALLDASGDIRSALLGRLRTADQADTDGSTAALGFEGLESIRRAAGGAIETALPADALAYGPTPGDSAGRGGHVQLTAWVQGSGSWGRSDANDDAAEMERRGGNVFVGIDRSFAELWRIGFATGYSRSDIDVDDRASSADVNTFHVAGYAGATFDHWSLRGAATFAWHDIDASRSVAFTGLSETEDASYHGSTGQAFGEVGYGVTSGNMAIEPFAGLAFAHLHTDSFVESGPPGGVAALAVASETEDVGYSSLGIRLATSVSLRGGMTLSPRASLAWQHAFGDVTPAATLTFQSTGTAFGIQGVPLARDAALLEAGLDLSVTPRVTVGVSYAGQLAGDVQDHAVQGKFAWRF